MLNPQKQVVQYFPKLLLLIISCILFSSYTLYRSHPVYADRSTQDCQPDWYWCSDHESGTFAEWEYNQGQAIYNSETAPGSSRATISAEKAHSGRYSMRLEITDAVDGQTQGARVFRRWIDSGFSGTDIPLPDEAYYSAWYYFPQVYSPKQWWNVFQFKSKPYNNSEGASQPMFSVHIEDHVSGKMSFFVVNKVAGVEDRTLYYQDSPKAIPVGEWVHLEVYLKQNTSQNGHLRIWQDGELILARNNINTINSQDNKLQWSINNYTDDIRPKDVVIYVDDAVISPTQVGPNLSVGEDSSACSIYASENVPKGLPNGDVWNRSYLTIDDGTSIEDLSINLDIEHAKIADLTVNLEHVDTGYSTTLIDRPGSLDGGCANQDLAVRMNDDANTAAESQCRSSTPTLSGNLKPTTPLSVFNGMSLAGQWALTIEDADPAANAGTLNGWSLENCPADAISAQPAPENLSCTTYTSNNVPRSVPIGNRWNGSSLWVSSVSQIMDINVNVDLAHSAIGDLTLSLHHSESNMNVLLLERPGRPTVASGCRFDNLDANFDDDATTAAEDTCASAGMAISGAVKPHSPLQALHGIDAAGSWFLIMEDANPERDVGTLNDWSIEICTASSTSGAGMSGRLRYEPQIFVPFWVTRQ